MTEMEPHGRFIRVASALEWVYMWSTEWNIDVDKSSEDDQNAVLICVHGLTRTGRDFDVLARAACSGKWPYRKVVCPDIIGRGKSHWLSPEPPYFNQYGYPMYVSNIGQLFSLLEQEPPFAASKKVDFIGTSMGGIIGMTLAAMRGVDCPIRKLVLNDIGAVIEQSSLERIASYLNPNAPAREFASMAEAVAYFEDVHSAFGLTHEQWQALTPHGVKPVEKEDGTSCEAVKLCYDPKIAHAFSGPDVKLQKIELWHLWDKIKVPIMLVRGADSDLITKECVVEMQRRNPNLIKVLEVPSAGHAPGLAQADQIEAIRQFLES